MSRTRVFKEFSECLRSVEQNEPSVSEYEASSNNQDPVALAREQLKYFTDFLAVVQKVQRDQQKNSQEKVHPPNEKTSTKGRKDNIPSQPDGNGGAACPTRRAEARPTWITVQKIRDRVDRIRPQCLHDIEQLAHWDWPEEAFQITDVVNSISTAKKNIQVLITEDGNEADIDFFDTIGFEIPEVHHADDLEPGDSVYVSGSFPCDRKRKTDNLVSRLAETSLIVGKIKARKDKIRELTLMVERVKGVLKKIVSGGVCQCKGEPPSIVLHLPSAVKGSTGRKIVECSMRDFGRKIQVCQRPEKRREDAPTSRLSIISIRADATTGFKYLKVVSDLKERVLPSACGVEVHKIYHATNGDIRLRIRENEFGGKRKFAIKIRENLGLHCCFRC